MLASYTDSSFGGISGTEFEAKREFFSEVGRLVNQTKFKNKAEKIIMEMFADGRKVLEIQRELNRMKIRIGKGRNHRTTISNVVTRHLIIFGLYTGGVL